MWKVFIGLYINGRVDCPTEYRPAKARTAKEARRLLEVFQNTEYEPIEKKAGTILLRQKELRPTEKCYAGALIIRI